MIKFLIIIGIGAVGIIAVIFTIATEPLQKGLMVGMNASLNQTAHSTQGLSAIMNGWIILPVILMVCLIGYGIYKVVTMRIF